MHGPPTPAMGRGMLIFAVLVGSLGLFLLLTRQWLNAGLWLAIAVFIGCYGTIMSSRHGPWDKILVGLGAIAALIAWGLVIKITGFGF